MILSSSCGTVWRRDSLIAEGTREGNEAWISVIVVLVIAGSMLKGIS